MCSGAQRTEEEVSIYFARYTIFLSTSLKDKRQARIAHANSNYKKKTLTYASVPKKKDFDDHPCVMHGSRREGVSSNLTLTLMILAKWVGGWAHVQAPRYPR